MLKFVQNLFRRRRLCRDDWRKNPDIGWREARAGEAKLVRKLEDNLELLNHFCGPSFDVSVRRFTVGVKVPAALVHLDGLVDSRTAEEILRDLMMQSRQFNEPGRAGEIETVAREHLLAVTEVRQADNIADLFVAVSSGDVVLLFDGVQRALLCNAKGFQIRAITEPGTEQSLRGPREGFIESLRTNTSLIRRRIRTSHLWMESLIIGDLTQTEVVFAYIKGLAREKLIREVRDRLQRIKIDGVLESGYLEEFIEDAPNTVFPMVLRTERPDRVAAALLQGRVAIFTDGTPHVLVVPAELNMLMQAPDDYYELPPVSLLVRPLRYFSTLVSLILPGFYVAVINFHQELLPTALLLRITASREGVPFPAIAEVLILDGLFEMLREAVVRLPTPIGPTISIVGALILGDAAIRAGLVSPVVVIVIALTAIASFTSPVFSLGISFRILRFAFTVLGAVFGLFGIQFGLLVLAVHLCSLRSFGLPYMTPFAPLVWTDLKDSLLRYWWWGMRQRPKLFGGRDPQRIPPGQEPYGGKDPGEGEGET